MTEARYVRRLPPVERSAAEPLRPADPQAAELPSDSVLCRTTTVHVNLARLLADLDAEARRLLGGALAN